MNTHKGLAPIVWVIIAAIVLGGGYAVYEFSKPKLICWPYCSGMTDQDREDIKKSVLDAQTANWKTYRNEKYGFEVAYPATWFIQDNLSETTCCLNITNTMSLSERPKPDEVKIQIQRYTKSAATGLREFVVNSDSRGTTMENFAISDIQGIKTNALGDGVYFLPQSDMAGVRIIVFGGPETPASIRQQIDKILSTFRFTK